jgi:hypothetical protein
MPELQQLDLDAYVRQCQGGNHHVHWHVAPLPSGVPYRQQQLEALRMERGILSLPDEEMASLALRLRRRIDRAKGRQP